MTFSTTPTNLTNDDMMPRELAAIMQLESTPNAIRLRIAGLAPDQLYRGTNEDLSIAEQLGFAVERERAYLIVWQAALADRAAKPVLVEPQPTMLLLDRDFGDDLALFFDLRRATLDIVRALSSAQWEQAANLEGKALKLRDLGVRLAQHDGQMLASLSNQRRHWLRTTGVDDLRDSGLAGHLGPNLAQ